MRRLLLLLLLVGCQVPASSYSTMSTTTYVPITLNDDQIAAFARLALDGIVRPFPNKPGQVYTGPASAVVPEVMHPVFYGSFDWHSAVHGHWMLLRLLRLYPDHPIAEEIRQRLDEQLTAGKLATETAYFDEPQNRGFERMYGWAWLLRLAQELELGAATDADMARWRDNLRPLEERLVALSLDYLPRLDWPIRTGVHPDSGFALAMLLDYARAVHHPELEQLVLSKARQFYLEDRDYHGAFEPSGEDFFSTAWNEADLMRRVLSKEEFSRWLRQFLPELANGKLGNLLTPVEVSDPTDGRLVHLAGLDLSRAWAMEGVASALPTADPRRWRLFQAARAHQKAGLAYVFSGYYEGEHWLASFAIFLLTQAGLDGAE